MLLSQQRAITGLHKPQSAKTHVAVVRRPYVLFQQRQQQSCRQCCPPPAAAAASPNAQPQQEPAAAAAVAASQPEAADAVQDVEQQQASSSSIGLPPGPMEPPDEEPQKLSNASRLSEALASTSITIFGDDTELNWAVCQALSKKIGWFPVSTRKVLLGLQKAETLEELISTEGREAVVEAEAKMLKGMRGQMRCCTATIGDAAAADASLYPNLYGTILIWLDEEDKRSPKPATPARAVYYQQAEIRAKVDVRKGGFGAKEVEDKASRAASQVIKGMLALLKQNKDLLVRKRLYLEMGCRGDWPELMPADWNPVVDALPRKPVA